MTTFLLIVHMLVTITMVAVILLQRDSGGLGGLGGGSGLGSLFSVRGSANFLTRLTAILATAFIVLSLLLAIIASHTHTEKSILEGLTEPSTVSPIEQPVKQEEKSVLSPEPGPASISSQENKDNKPESSTGR